MMIKKSVSIFSLSLLVGSCAVFVTKTTSQKEQAAIKAGSAATHIDASSVMTAFEGTADLKIRYIDMFAAMRESQEGQQVSKELDAKRKEYAQKIEQEEKRLQQAMTEYRSKSSMLSESARSKEEQQLAKMKREYEGVVKNSEEELKLIMQQKTEQLGRKVDKAVTEVAKKDGLDAVVDKVSGRVIYTSQKSDCTTKITQAMNTTYETVVAQGDKKSEAVSVASNKK